MTWVVDTGPLSHFAKSGWLGVLEMLAPDHRIIIPDTVGREIELGSAVHVHLAPVLQHGWIHVHPVQSAQELEAFGRYARRLVGNDDRNVGECGVLALAEVHGWTAIVDDAEAVKAANEVPAAPVTVRRTLGLLCEAVREGRLTEEMISSVCDALVRSHYRVPFKPGEFIVWAKQRGQL